MRLSDFKFKLPEELIAQFPSRFRDEARMLVLHTKTGAIEHKLVSDLAGKSFNSLQAVAEAYNTTIGEAKSVSVSNARLQSLGYEPIVGAAVAKAQEGVLNGPVKGQNAAIYYVVSNKQTVSTDVDVKNEVENMSRTYMYRLPYLIMPYLNKEADVEDSRAKFY